MDELKELINVSSFKPSSGDLLAIYQQIESNGQTNGFTPSYTGFLRSELKNKLLNRIFEKEVSRPTAYRKKFKWCVRRMAQLEYLVLTDCKKSAYSNAKTLLAKADKIGLVGICLRCARLLRNYYGNVGARPKLYLKYDGLVDRYRAEQNNLLDMEGGFFKLVHLLRANESVEEVEPLFLDGVTSAVPRYHYLKFVGQFHIYESRGAVEKMLGVCSTALVHFGGHENPLPYVYEFTFYLHLIRHCLTVGEYDKAESHVSKCLEAMPGQYLGTYNWNLVLLYRAAVGFHSGKPAIAAASYRMAKRVLAKHKNKTLLEMWHLVRLCLEMYVKVGALQIKDGFRVYKYLNSIPTLEKDKPGTNVMAIICKVMLLLLDGKKNEYEDEAEKINSYLFRNLKGEAAKRGRYILRLLECVPKGRFYRTATELKARKWALKLKAATFAPSVNPVFGELVPFEKVWEMALNSLK